MHERRFKPRDCSLTFARGASVQSGGGVQFSKQLKVGVHFSVVAENGGGGLPCVFSSQG